MVRHVLREQQAQGLIRCSGRGVGAVWSKADGGNQGNPLPLNRGNDEGNGGGGARE